MEPTLSGVFHAQPEAQTHLPLASALQISLDVVRMVAAKHDEGQVVGVLDAAHLVCQKSGALSFGGIGGNPIAPELKRGDKPDRLTDVYALGALIYRLLTGRKVDQLKVIEPPSHFNPAVDMELDELVLQTLDEDPSERPYSARALERQMVDIFSDLGLEPGDKGEATSLIQKALKKAAQQHHEIGAISPRAEVRKVHVVEDEGDDEPPYRNGFQQWMYDMGWSSAGAGAVGHYAAASKRHVDPESIERNRFEQWMYDCGWFQNVDWRAPETKTWLKRGGIALGVLLLLFIVWPSHKPSRPTAKDLAVAAMQKQSGVAPASTVKSQVRPATPEKKPVRSARR